MISPSTFLYALFFQSSLYQQTGCITLTAIHPDGQHRTSSRHIPLNQPDMLEDALDRLLQANQMGWRAYVAIGLRRKGLTRYRRGGFADVVALPAVFVDVDNPSQATLTQLHTLQQQPSCIVFSGGGYDAYWWLDEPLTDMMLAHHLLRGLARLTSGDSLLPAQSLRLVQTSNTKEGRNKPVCHVIVHNQMTYPLDSFTSLMPKPTPKRLNSHRQTTVTRRSGKRINPNLIQAVSNTLISLGYVQRGDWLCGPCLYPNHHQHDDQHPSFGFNTHKLWKLLCLWIDSAQGHL